MSTNFTLNTAKVAILAHTLTETSRPIDYAQAYTDSGLSVMPIKGDGTKQPLGPWKVFQERHRTNEEIKRDWSRDNTGIAIIYGKISRSSELIDFDNEEVFPRFQEQVEQRDPGLLERISIIKTPRPGYHVVYRCQTIEGNQVLAERPDGLDEKGKPKKKALIETRGEGGYALAPGSPGCCHESGRTYDHFSGPPLTELAEITPAERATLFEVAATFNEVVDDPKPDPTESQQHHGLTPGDDFNQRATWEEILTPHGWLAVFAARGLIHWLRPGKTIGTSATTGVKSKQGAELFCCFSTGAYPFEGSKPSGGPCTSYSKFAAYTLLNHNGDYSAAAKELSGLGYGTPLTDSVESREKAKCVSVNTYKPFPIHCLPGVVGEFVKEAAKAIGCDYAFIALPILCCLARAVGNSRVIRLKATWTEPAILWAAIVGKSGSYKSPALQAVMKFLERPQEKAIAKHAEALQQHVQDKAEWERAYIAWKRDKKSSKPTPCEPPEPVLTRYATSDCTIEALAALLAVQFDGVLVQRDELAGWLGGIAEYKGGKGSDLGHWLACWSGLSLTIDRKTGTIKFIFIPRAAVSLLGGIQPGVLRSAIAKEHMQDGLCARVLFAMPDPRQVVWSEAVVDSRTESAATELFDTLFTLEPHVNDEGGSEPLPMDLTPEAKVTWAGYFNRHRAEQVDLDDDLSAAWSKLEAYTARFALIFQLCSWAEGDAKCDVIDEVAISAAIELSDWFGNEAKRVYGLFVESDEDREIRELVELIRRKGNAVSPRDLMRSCRKFKISEDAEKALNILEGLELGSWHVVSTGTNQGRIFTLFEPSTLTD